MRFAIFRTNGALDGHQSAWLQHARVKISTRGQATRSRNGKKPFPRLQCFQLERYRQQGPHHRIIVIKTRCSIRDRDQDRPRSIMTPNGFMNGLGSESRHIVSLGPKSGSLTYMAAAFEYLRGQYAGFRICAQIRSTRRKCSVPPVKWNSLAWHFGAAVIQEQLFYLAKDAQLKRRRTALSCLTAVCRPERRSHRRFRPNSSIPNAVGTVPQKPLRPDDGKPTAMGPNEVYKTMSSKQDRRSPQASWPFCSTCRRPMPSTRVVRRPQQLSAKGAENSTANSWETRWDYSSRQIVALRPEYS